MKNLIFTLLLAILTLMPSAAQDPNFHIYLCLGQSNMEGAGQIETIDRENVPERFQMMAAVDFNNPQRTQGEWYTAVPPLVRQSTGLCPADWFGRTMVDNLPEDIKIGVIVVAIGGCKIEHLDKDYDPATVTQEADWFQSFMAAYDNKPYDRLISCAKEAQKAGVIKGILLHQGESNNCQEDWLYKVKKVYEDMLADLNLQAEDVPLLAGEMVSKDMGGVCWGHNAIIDRINTVIPTAYPISSANLPNKGDGLHFTSHGYRVLGCRYATKMLELQGIENPVVNYSEEIPEVPQPKPQEGDFVFDFKYFDPTIWESGTFDPETNTFTAGLYGFGGWEYQTPIDLSGYKYLVAELGQQQFNGASFRVFDTASYWELPYSIDFDDKTLLVCDLDGMMKPTKDGGIEALNTKTVYRVGFWAYGGQPIVIKQVFATNENPYNSQATVEVNDNKDLVIFNLQGSIVNNPQNGIYLVKQGNKVSKIKF